MASPYPPGPGNPYAAKPSQPYAAPSAYPYAAPHAYYQPPPQKSWVWLALIGGHLGAAAYATCGAGLLVIVGFAVADIPNDEGAMPAAIMIGFLAAFCFGLTLVAEIITIGMHFRKKWAWFAGLAMFALYLPSLFMPMGAMGMCGLLMGGSRQEFGVG